MAGVISFFPWLKDIEERPKVYLRAAKELGFDEVHTFSRRHEVGKEPLFKRLLPIIEDLRMVHSSTLACDTKHWAAPAELMQGDAGNYSLNIQCPQAGDEVKRLSEWHIKHSMAVDYVGWTRDFEAEGCQLPEDMPWRERWALVQRMRARMFAGDIVCGFRYGSLWQWQNKRATYPLHPQESVLWLADLNQIPVQKPFRDRGEQVAFSAALASGTGCECVNEYDMAHPANRPKSADEFYWTVDTWLHGGHRWAAHNWSLADLQEYGEAVYRLNQKDNDPPEDWVIVSGTLEQAVEQWRTKAKGEPCRLVWMHRFGEDA